MSNTVQARVYQIRIEGHLSPEWIDWFEGLLITPVAGGETLLTGPDIDQAALYGLLKKVRDLGLPLVAVNRIEAHKADGLEIHESHPKRSKGDNDEHRKSDL